jgi:carbamoyltransferase
VRKEFRGVLPAITHVDGSSRIQTVSKEQNPRYYDLLMALKKRTGRAIVLNTSFNDAGEPIVCSPHDALRCYFATGFDALAIGDFLLEK